MAHPHDHEGEGTAPAHNHNCGGLSAAATKKVPDHPRGHQGGAFDNRAADRLLHMDEVQQERLDGILSDGGRARRQLLQASSFMERSGGGRPRFGSSSGAGGGDTAAPATALRPCPCRRLDKETVAARVFDATLPPDFDDSIPAMRSAPEHAVAFSEPSCSPGCRSLDWQSCRTMQSRAEGHTRLSGLSRSRMPSRRRGRDRYRRLLPVTWGRCSTTRRRWVPAVAADFLGRDRSNTSISTWRRCKVSLRPTSIFR